MIKKESFSLYTKMKTFGFSTFILTLHSAYDLYEALQSYDIQNVILFVYKKDKKDALRMSIVLQDPGDRLSPDDFCHHFVTLMVKKCHHLP